MNRLGWFVVGAIVATVAWWAYWLHRAKRMLALSIVLDGHAHVRCPRGCGFEACTDDPGAALTLHKEFECPLMGEEGAA